MAVLSDLCWQERSPLQFLRTSCEASFSQMDGGASSTGPAGTALRGLSLSLFMSRGVVWSIAALPTERPAGDAAAGGASDICTHASSTGAGHVGERQNVCMAMQGLQVP
jgi:hypothetical protein